MASSDHSADSRRTGPQDEDPATAVPEADAAEQRTAASDDGREDWVDEASADVFDQASEADVIEQAREVGSDDDERR
ncbi:hypothetical protein [Nocardiopsis nanhaiensis]